MMIEKDKEESKRSKDTSEEKEGTSLPPLDWQVRIEGQVIVTYVRPLSMDGRWSKWQRLYIPPGYCLVPEGERGRIGEGHCETCRWWGGDGEEGFLWRMCRKTRKWGPGVRRTTLTHWQLETAVAF